MHLDGKGGILKGVGNLEQFKAEACCRNSHKVECIKIHGPIQKPHDPMEKIRPIPQMWLGNLSQHLKEKNEFNLASHCTPK